MKKWLLTIVPVLFVLLVVAQSDTAYPYKRFPTVPPISLLQVDSSLLTKDKLKRDPVIIMYFSPSCDHCQHQIGDMLKRIDEFKNTQLVLATYQPFEEMVEFCKTYELAKYSNIKVGRDTKFVLPPFYHIQSLPYLALYNKKGNLVTTWQGNVPVDTLLKALQ
jgi:thioredoxin-related protein